MMRDVTCPVCNHAIESTKPMWVYLGQWYCSEQCVLAAQPTEGHP